MKKNCDNCLFQEVCNRHIILAFFPVDLESCDKHKRLVEPYNKTLTKELNKLGVNYSVSD